MKLTSKRNFLFILAAILVVAMGIMSISLYNKNKYNMSGNYNKEIQTIVTQSDSTETDDIEKDLNDTSIDDVDKELQNIENELNNL